jgi:hypothetical protein
VQFATKWKRMLPPETRVLAQRLLANEADTGNPSVPTESAAFRVYEKLRRHLCALAGVAGFQALASRALTLARAEAPSLSAVQLTADGTLQGLEQLEPPIDSDKGGDEVILIAQLLGLLFIFIGEALTLRLVQDVWPDLGTRGKHAPTR